MALFHVTKKVSSKEFHLPKGEELNCLTTNYNDQYIASGTRKGSIYLLNTLTNQVGAALKGVEPYPVTSLQYNHGHKGVLAASNEGGSVSFWDCNENKLVTQFKQQHSAPCTGLAFSPLNNILMLSAGLDKKCVCYDTKAKSAFSYITTSHPLTSVEALLDGKTIALGTSNGRVLFYDLRDYSRPVKELDLKNSLPVKGLTCQPAGDNFPLQSASRIMPSTKPRLAPAAGPSAAGLPAVTKMKENRSPSPFDSARKALDERTSTPDTSGGGRESLGSTVFSPLRGNVSANVSPANSVRSTSTLGVPGANSFVSNTNISHDSVFSPLRENNSNSDSKLGGSFLPKTPIGSFNRSHGSFLISPAPLANIREEEAKLARSPGKSNSSDAETPTSPVKVVHQNEATSFPYDFPKSPNPSKPSLFVTPASSERLLEGRNAAAKPTESVTSFRPSNIGIVASTPFAKAQTSGNSKTIEKADVIEDKRPKVTFNEPTDQTDSNSNRIDAQPKVAEETERDETLQKPMEHGEEEEVSELKAMMMAFPGALSADLNPLKAVDEEGVKSAVVASVEDKLGGHAQVFQQEFLRNCVEDAMDDFCTDVRKQMWHLQYDMIRAFQTQRDEMSGLLAQYAVNDALAAENERLKRENEELRSYFLG